MQQLEQRVQDFQKAPEKSLLKLSIPVVLGMLVQVIYNITDTAFVGRIGVDALAAITFSFPIYFVGMAVGNLLGSGAGPLISRAIGAKKLKEASSISILLFLLSGLFSIGLLLLGMLLLRPVLGLMGGTPVVVNLAADYLFPLIFSLPILFLAGAFSTVFYSEGNTKLPAIVSAISVVINLSLDYLFIFRYDMGIFGASLATVLAFTFSALTFVFFLFFTKQSLIPIHFCGWRPSWKQSWAIFRLGMPSSAAHFMMAFSWFFFNGLFAQFGTSAVAAYGLVGRIDSIAFLPLMGLSVGLVTLTGMFYGAKKYSLLIKILRAAILYGLLYAVPLLLIVWFLPNFFLGILTNDAHIIDFGTSLLRIEVFAYPLMAIGFLLGRFLLGLGDGKPGLIITSIRLLVVAVPLAWLFSRVLEYGPRSIIVAMLISGCISVLVGTIWTRWKLRQLS